MLVAPPIVLREEGGFLSEQISVRGQYHFKSLFLGVIRTREANQRLLAKVNIHRHNNNTFYCRVFDEAKAAQAGVKVKDWRSLDEHLDLILWEGYFDKETATVRTEKFAK